MDRREKSLRDIDPATVQKLRDPDRIRQFAKHHGGDDWETLAWNIRAYVNEVATGATDDPDWPHFD